MRKQRTLIGLIVIALMLLSASAAWAEELPPEIEALRTYILEEDYPELFKGSTCVSKNCENEPPYRVQLENVLITDLDGDGETELVAQFYPHFRQSPPIVIYRLSRRGKVSRVTEGLAPGRLIPVSGDYIDSHVGGWGVDLDLQAQQDDPKARRAFVIAALGEMGNVVEYLTFFHADGRQGEGTYIDMTFIEKDDIPGDRNCESFEFSRVQGIAAGRIKGGGKNTYLAASVADSIYVYRISGFTKEGFLEKKLWVVPRPEGFKALIPNGEGFIEYEDTEGKTSRLKAKLK